MPISHKTHVQTDIGVESAQHTEQPESHGDIVQHSQQVSPITNADIAQNTCAAP